MADVFLSYSSKDRTRAQLVRVALEERGFTVFWDQEVPAGTDWDTWIRRHLNEARCAIVLWSENSLRSDNVRHEAVIARQQTKLIPVLLEAVPAEHLPMGSYAVQLANLSQWTGDDNDLEWQKLIHLVEATVAPAWVKRALDTLEADLVGERVRRESAERRDRVLREKIASQAESLQELERDAHIFREQSEQVHADHAEQLRRGSELQERVSALTTRLSLVEAEYQDRNRSLQQELGRCRDQLHELTRKGDKLTTSDGKLGGGVAGSSAVPDPTLIALEWRVQAEHRWLRAYGGWVPCTLETVTLSIALAGCVLSGVVSQLVFSYMFRTEDLATAYVYAMKSGWLSAAVPAAAILAWARRAQPDIKWRVAAIVGLWTTAAYIADLLGGNDDGAWYGDDYIMLERLSVTALLAGACLAGVAYRKPLSAVGVVRSALVAGAYMFGPMVWSFAPYWMWNFHLVTGVIQYETRYIVFLIGATLPAVGHLTLATLGAYHAQDLGTILQDRIRQSEDQSDELGSS